MTNGIKVFTASWCGQCSALKKQLDVKGIMYEVIDVDTDEGGEIAFEWGVRSLPAAIIEDELYSQLGNIIDRVNKDYE